MTIQLFCSLLVATSAGTTDVLPSDSPAAVAPEASSAKEPIDPFFEDVIIEEVIVEPAIVELEGDDVRSGLSNAESIAHLHPAVVHLPIAWLLLLFLLEWLLVFRSEFVSESARVGLWALTILSFIPSLATGFVFSEWVYADTNADVMQPIWDHRNLILVSTALLAIGWFIRKRNPKGLGAALVLTLAMVAMTLGAHSGGTLVYGEDYFPF